MIEKMNTKLSRLENELGVLFDNSPTTGHGGTPFILDNSKGRAMKKAHDKHQESIRTKMRQIEEQKAKIERMEFRIYYRNTQTKKSQKYIEKNPIHPALIELSKTGEITQWKKNPHIFFIKELDKVAFSTQNGQIVITRRFPVKTEEEKKIALKIYEKLKLITRNLEVA